MGVICEIKAFDKVKKSINDTKKNAEKALKATMSDIRTKAPGWVADEVIEVYGIKRVDITKQRVGKVKVAGQKVYDAQIIYNGRVLTPTHFGMTPKKPRKGSYTLEASIINNGQKKIHSEVKKLTKKQRKLLGKNFTRSGTQSSEKSPIMLMHTGNAKEGGTNYIPFQRVSKNRKDIKAIKTLSLPQMVSSMRTAPQIQTTINENVEKRLEHNRKRFGV